MGSGMDGGWHVETSNTRITARGLEDFYTYLMEMRMETR